MDDDLSARLDAAAGSNASAYVAQAVAERLDREAAAQRIRDAYGEPDPAAYAYWIDRLRPQGSDQRAS